MLKDKFGRLSTIVKPRQPIQAVVAGAILLASSPSLIRSRKSQLTYGIQIYSPFQEGVHEESRKTTIAGRGGFFVERWFDPVVKYGEEVEIDSFVEKIYYPMYADQTAMSIKLYHTPLTEVKYTENLLCTGSIVVDMSDTTGGFSRQIKVRIYFGQSEIKVEAIEGISNTSYKAIIKYDGQKVDFIAPPTQKYHLIFINHGSESMTGTDVAATLPWIQNKNRRLGAVHEACYEFLKLRSNSSDIVSCISYNDSATIQFEKQAIDPMENVKKMFEINATGGTNFKQAILKLKDLVNGTPNMHTPVAFLVVDSTHPDGGAAAELTQLVSSHNTLTLHTILISNEANPQSVELQHLASVGKGQFFHSTLNLQQIKQMFTKFATLLE